VSQSRLIASRTFDEIEIGTTTSLQGTITGQDMGSFAAVSGDTNPTHLDPD